MPTDGPTLNTEENDIAGNRIDGPVGNTAAKPGPAVGQPGGVGNITLANGDESHAPTRPGSEPGALNNPIAEIPGEAGNHEGQTAPTGQQPEVYGGNFSNSTQGADHNRARYDNQASDPNRGEFGTQSDQGATHGGYGNQNREQITEHMGDGDFKYYPEGVVRPDSGDHNAYRAYDGRDERPDVRPSADERAVWDSAAPAAAQAAAPPTDGRGNQADNRNQPDRADAAAAHQNDNGSPQAQGAGFAQDYGHTSGAHLTGGSSQPQAAPAAAGRNQAEDGRSSRGGYDNQGSAGGDYRGSDAANGTGAVGGPAPTGADAPHAPQGVGYGHGYQRSEQPKEPDNATGSERSGATAGTPLATHGNDAAQGYGSRGGSYDDRNSGAHPEGLDQHTTQDQAGQEGPEHRAEHRPTDGDDESYGPMPRRNAGRDGQGDE